jgi:hypothetical protein
MDLTDLGRWIAAAGVVLVIVGGLLWLLGRVPGLSLGRLPGDLQMQVGPVSCFAPIATMLLISVVLTIVANILLRLFNK